MNLWARAGVAVVAALIGGAAGEHVLFEDSSSSADCSVHVSGATVRDVGEIAGCAGPSDAWLAHSEALVEEVRAEAAEAKTEIAEGE